jgi:FtsZ-binding cell division protein ZapB
MPDSLEQFRKLEEKLLKAAEAFKQGRAENRELEEEIERLRAEMKERAKRWDAQEKDIATLRREREEVRERIEKLIDQIDVLTKAERVGK